jgi:hypothetical protein
MSGIIIFPIVLIYIFVAFLIYKLVLGNTNKKFLSSMVFVGILTFPFLDLIVQKIIKEIYISTGVLESKIYTYPKKDVNGMIESYQLEVSTINSYWDDTVEKKIKNNYKNTLKEKIKYLDFIFSNEKNKIFRFYLSNENVVYKVINNEKARFRHKWKIHQEKIFGLYTLSGQEVIDTKTNTLLAESFSIGFPDIKLFKYIRDNILHLITGTGNSMINVDGINNHNNDLWLKLVWNINIKNKGNS